MLEGILLFLIVCESTGFAAVCMPILAADFVGFASGLGNTNACSFDSLNPKFQFSILVREKKNIVPYIFPLPDYLYFKASIFLSLQIFYFIVFIRSHREAFIRFHVLLMICV